MRVNMGVALAGALVAVGLSAGVAAAQGGDPERGGELYVENCAVCHGVDGEGRVGASLAQFPGIQVEATLVQTITRGVQGSVMPAWGEGFDGPLSEQEILDLAAYIQAAFEGTAPIEPLPTYPAQDLPPLPDVEGDPGQGAAVYQAECAVCHGTDGEGRIGAGLAKSWPASDPAAYIRQVVREGIPGTTRPAWGQAGGGPLSEDQIANVAAYVLTLSPAASATPAPSGPGPISLTMGLIALGIVAVLVIAGLVVYYRRA
jgi:cytochrome c oxidase cbb3-type subunit 3